MPDNQPEPDDEFVLQVGDRTACDWCKSEYVVEADMVDGPDIDDESWCVYNALPTCPYCFERFKRALGLYG